MARRGLLHEVRARQALVVGFAIAVLSATTLQIATATHDWILIGYWTLGASGIGGCLLAFVVGRRYTHLPVASGRVLCIVPAYNEPPESLARTVDALLAQTVEIDIVVIDDGSVVPVVPSRAHPRLRWLRQDNTGKRGAQVAVLREIPRDTYEFVLTVDSDSQPFPDACEHLLRSMWDPGVQAATGMIYVRNYRQSWIARATDIDIGGSCVMMRASRSMLGALETTSGALALYRSSLLYDHLDAYAVECGTGDDRWLALRALRRGEVVAVAEACVETDMPVTVRGTYRQRLRWARSWWWMLPYVFRHLRPRQFLSPLYGITQLVVTPFLLIYAAAVGTSIWVGQGDASSATVWLYGIDYLVIRYVLAALYLIGRPDMPTRDKWVSFFVGTPGAIMLNVLLLSPTRYWALARLFDNRWQTRQARDVVTELA
jgi:cellulose synthase/poly-beta-1,6-N-acetylglucosamine synthase-like glycosyltransferase